MTTVQLALILKADLTVDGLKNYIAEQERMIQNEIKMGRKPTIFRKRKNAGEIALKNKEQ